MRMRLWSLSILEEPPLDLHVTASIINVPTMDITENLCRLMLRLEQYMSLYAIQTLADIHTLHHSKSVKNLMKDRFSDGVPRLVDGNRFSRARLGDLQWPNSLFPISSNTWLSPWERFGSLPESATKLGEDSLKILIMFKCDIFVNLSVCAPKPAVHLTKSPCSIISEHGISYYRHYHTL
jgi:hypothetical protein